MFGHRVTDLCVGDIIPQIANFTVTPLVQGGRGREEAEPFESGETRLLSPPFLTETTAGSHVLSFF